MIKNKLAEYWLMKQAEWGREITGEEVAEFIGFSRQTVSAYRTGRIIKLDKNIVDGICSFFKCPPGQPVPWLIYSPDE